MPKLVKQEVQTELFDEQMLKQVLHDRHSELDSESFEDSDNGYRNAELVLSEKELLDNIHKIQDKNFIININILLFFTFQTISLSDKDSKKLRKIP